MRHYLAIWNSSLSKMLVPPWAGTVSDASLVSSHQTLIGNKCKLQGMATGKLSH